MPLTRQFKETVKIRARRERPFREALLREAADCLLAGDLMTGKAVLRDYVNATIGFTTLGRGVSRSPKSLMRMLGPGGNPQAASLFQMLGHLQRREGVRLSVRSTRVR